MNIEKPDPDGETPEKESPWATFDFIVEKQFLDHLLIAGAVQMTEIEPAKRAVIPHA